MKTLIFCARNFTDYLKLNNKREVLARAGEISARDILENETAQKFLLEKMKFYPDYKRGLTTPIACETGIEGLRLDFNFGLRLELPEGNFHVKISDYDSEMIFLDENLSDVRLISLEKNFIRWRVEIYLNGKKIFEHKLDLENRPVLIAIRLTGLGDIISTLPFAREFKRQNNCKLSVLLPEYMREFAAHLYPDIAQVNEINFNSYATYYPVRCLGEYPIFPADVRNEPLERFDEMILGFTALPAKPTFKSTAPKNFAEPYVCIGVQASTTIKGWLYPGGWDIVVDYLKSLGYRVFCIDRNAEETNDGRTIRKPEGAEDFTGDFSIMERANMLYHAEFFIGLGSGLSWLADAVNCPVVLICGFSKNWCEFYTPYRVANRLVCNGCLNDVRVNFVWDVCPYHKGTPRELECQKKIQPRQVLDAVERLIIDRNLKPPALI